jgi:hypothetical protein
MDPFHVVALAGARLSAARIWLWASLAAEAGSGALLSSHSVSGTSRSGNACQGSAEVLAKRVS